ncbi:hypothetical protein B2J93_6865 [Marssonina coronariae]|uniref:CN hydrolase domain-containing protein n=1 Tax=Diplocarpon coronariae TaxID=2795749 RepID=A0A218YVJ1_9HELO|nr:hypothetical protein B2J93_6865 [Marssonina coronariae]
MRIACLQFAPQVGDVDNNLNRADAVLNRANPRDLDLLVLPELAFSGYNFKSLQQISPYLEPTAAGITSLWARTTALKYDCVVTAGYPEKVDISPRWPASPEYYSSAITVNAEGETIANYRKSFLYHADETWALEGPDGFYDGEIDGLGNVAMGICKWPTRSFERMDLNPYKFEAPWSAWEFAYHILHKSADLVIISMAWLTREDARAFSRTPREPDMETLSYWLARLEPLIRAEGDDEIIVVLANRCGTEGEAIYAGTSAVLGIQSGEVKVYGILGRGERELLVVDTKCTPQAKLISDSSCISRTSERASRALLPRSTLSRQVPASCSRYPSSESAKSRVPAQSAATKLSVSTTVGAAAATASRTSASPSTPNAMDLSLDLDDMIAPLSPVDARSPSSFFARAGDASFKEPREYLRSSIDRLKPADLARPKAPTHASRDASRGRNHDVGLGLASPDLGQAAGLPPRTSDADAQLDLAKSPRQSASVLPGAHEDSWEAQAVAAVRLPMPSRPRSVNW